MHSRERGLGPDGLSLSFSVIGPDALAPDGIPTVLGEEPVRSVRFAGPTVDFNEEREILGAKYRPNSDMGQRGADMAAVPPSAAQR